MISAFISRRLKKPAISLRAVLIWIAILSAGLSCISSILREAEARRRAVEYLTAKGGGIIYDDENFWPDITSDQQSSSTPSFLCRLLGRDVTSNVISLNLKNTEITDDDLKQVAMLSELKWLWLDDTGVTDEGLRHLRNLTKLESLSLYDTSITDRGLVFLSELKNLEDLRLGDTAITDDGLIHLRSLTKLRTISAVRSRVSNAGLRHVELIKNRNRQN